MAGLPNLGLANTFNEWLQSHNMVISDFINPIANTVQGYANGNFTHLNANTVNVGANVPMEAGDPGVTVLAANNDVRHLQVVLRNRGDGVTTGFQSSIGFDVTTGAETLVAKTAVMTRRERTNDRRGTLILAVNDDNDDDGVTHHDAVWSFDPVDLSHTFRIANTDIMSLAPRDTADLSMGYRLRVDEITSITDANMGVKLTANTVTFADDSTIDTSDQEFKVSDVSGTLTVPANNDQFVVSDEDVNEDPNRRITAGNLRTYMADLRDVWGTQIPSFQNDDRLFLTDESQSGDPMRYATWINVRTAIRSGLAALASPTFTGTPRAPTQGTRTNSSTQIATTAFVQNRVGGLGTLADQANIPWNLNNASVAQVTLAGNRTLANPTNGVAGDVYVLEVTQDTTGGRTLAFGSNYNFGDQGTPTLSSGGGDQDVLSFLFTGSEMKMVGIAKGF